MPEILEWSLVRKEWPIIFVVDVSNNNSPDELDEINFLMRELIELIKEEYSHRSRGQITMNALLFSERAKWLVKGGLVPVNEFEWNDVNIDKGEAHIEAAIDELNRSLSRDSFFTNHVGYLVPIIVFVSNGRFPLDDMTISKIDAIGKSNRWYHNSKKIAVVVGDEESNSDNLKSIAGSVIKSFDIEKLNKILAYFSIGGTSAPIVPDELPDDQENVEVHILNQVRNISVNDVINVKKCEVEITSPDRAADPFVDIECLKRNNSASAETHPQDDGIWELSFLPGIDKSLFFKVTNTGSESVKILLSPDYYRSDDKYTCYEIPDAQRTIERKESTELILLPDSLRCNIVVSKEDNMINIEDPQGRIEKIGIELMPGEARCVELGDIICNIDNEALISFKRDLDDIWNEVSQDDFI